MTPLLAEADRKFKAAIQRVKDKQGSWYYGISSWATTGDPLKEVTNLDSYYDMWRKRVAALPPGDTMQENRLIAQAQTYIEQANALIGYAEEVTLGQAVKYTIEETVKDIKKPLSKPFSWVPYIAGAAILVVLAGLFYRARGR
jgi:hypothetical protein